MLSKVSILTRKSAISNIYRCISSSSHVLQGSEITKAKEKFDAVKLPEKKPPRAPLIKNFTRAVVDRELLAFPEALIDVESQNNAKMRKDSYHDFLVTNVFVDPNDNKNILKMRDYGSFYCSPELTTERLYASAEPESQQLSYSHFISNHKLVADLIIKYCDEQTKQNYLSKMSRGDLMGVICMTEKIPPQTVGRPFNTVCIRYEDEFTISGEKAFVFLQDLESSVFLVAASIESTNKCGDFEEKIGLFLIDGNTPGVSIIETHETIGFAEGPFKRVTLKFDKVKLGISRFLSEDIRASLNLLNQLRLNVGTLAVAGVMRPTINKLSDYFINTKVQNIFFKDLDIMKETVGRLASHCYALESMVYFTAALKDIYEDQDIDLECAAVKSFAVQILDEFITAPINTVGPLSTYDSEVYQKLIRDSIQLIGIEEPNETLKQFISLCGMNYAGKHLNDKIKKERNILDHPMFFFTRMKHEISIHQPKLKMNLWHDLHESLKPSSDFLEASIYRLAAVIEILLARFGTQIFLHSIECGKVAEIATLCYAMFTSASRASRSYCIGLRNADQEVSLTNALCYELHERIKKIAIEIDDGEFASTIHIYRTVGEKLIESKSYHLEHPTTRNF